MIIIDGKKIAREIIETLKKMPQTQNKLAAVFVGDNPASASFLRQKRKIAEELGIAFQLYQFSESISEEDLQKEVKKIGEDQTIGGMIVQLPLTEKFQRDIILSALNPGKDVDALHPQSEVFPLAVEVVKDILKEIHYEISDKVVGVVGRGLLVGEPIAKWLLGNCREVIVFHTKTDLSRIQECDLIISGAGKAGLIKPSMLKTGAGVIDFGFSVAGGKIRGDLDISQLTNQPINQLTFYTPTPGGTGPILVAELFRNFYKLTMNSK